MYVKLLVTTNNFFFFNFCNNKKQEGKEQKGINVEKICIDFFLLLGGEVLH